MMYNISLRGRRLEVVGAKKKPGPREGDTRVSLLLARSSLRPLHPYITLSYSKTSVSSVPTYTQKQHFQKVPLWRPVPFSLIVFIGYVWTEAVSVKKKLRFQIKTDSRGQGLNLINPRVLKIERVLLVTMLNSAPFTVRP